MKPTSTRPIGNVVALPLTHLIRLTDARGLFEHADHSTPRREHGYCLDDVSRGLIVAIRHRPGLAASRLIERYLGFIEAAVQPDGRAHNRMHSFGVWTDEPGLGDWWGRAVMALGFAAAYARTPELRRRAHVAFDRAAQQRSPHLRAMVSAAIGSADLLERHPSSSAARALLLDSVAAIPDVSEGGWPWPETRLRYGNAAIPEALLAAGTVLKDPRLTKRGLDALSFLLAVETHDGHLSVTGTGGRGPGEHDVQFDQQPIEVAAIADAGARAFRLGHGDRWAAVVRLAWAWFLGDNDAGVAMIDPASGAGFDGLEPTGRNQNQGAESTLAALSTFQQVAGLERAER